MHRLDVLLYEHSPRTSRGALSLFHTVLQCASSEPEEAYQWVEFFCGCGMATRCVTAAGSSGVGLDILCYQPTDVTKHNPLDLLTPAGMASLI